MKELLTKAKEHKKLKKDKEYEERGGELYGVEAPACILPNGKQTLLEIDSAGSNIYLIKVVNIEKDIRLVNGITIEKDGEYIWPRNRFVQYANALRQFKRKNIGDELCDPTKTSMKIANSAYCYECVYVMKKTDLSKNEPFKSALSKSIHNTDEQNAILMYEEYKNILLPILEKK